MTKQIAETTDGQFMVLVNGLQWGTKRDRSGASTQTWPTREAAQKSYRKYDDYLATHKLVFWETAAIVDTFRELAGLI